jgi:ATP-binding cassette subfamily C protein LapB
MQRVKHDFREAKALFDLPIENRQRTRNIPLIGNIKLQNAGYQSQNDVIIPIQGLNLIVKAGETIAFEGSDGGGRSTLSRIMSGGLEPTTGSVLVDDHDLYGDDHRSLRSQIAYVGNDAEMFSGTILQNLTLFGSQSTSQTARMAADLIGLEKDIHLLPLGYDTQLGNSIQENLTDSMIQRIAIARALASEPKILILNDANGALDHRSEAELTEGLKRLKGQLTMIIVSHRPSFRAVADKQYLVEDGQLKAIPATPPRQKYKLRRRQPASIQKSSQGA